MLYGLLEVKFADRAITTSTVNRSYCWMLFWQTWVQELPLSRLCMLQHTWKSIHTNLNIQPPVKSSSGWHSHTERLHVNLLIVIWMKWKEAIKDSSDWQAEGGWEEAGGQETRPLPKGNKRGVKAGWGQEERWGRDKNQTLQRVRGEEMKDGGGQERRIKERKNVERWK